jgi:small nuclear ribonucleoprotein (snRNP)-like protein
MQTRSGKVSMMLEELIGETVVVDLRSTFVCLGKLQKVDDRYLELHDADLHDLRDTRSTRENYIAASCATGIKRNRRKVLLQLEEMVAISRLNDVVDD